MNYHRLTEGEREEISRMLAQGCSFGEIAHFLGRSVSTISNEVSVGGCNRYTYRAATAHRRAQRKARKRKAWKRKILLMPRLRRYVHSKLRLRWSPDEIARKIAIEYPQDTTMRISPEAIYSYIYVLPKGTLKKELLACLRRERKRRHKRRKHGTESVVTSKIQEMLSIEERPIEVAERLVPGHWEGDLLVGKNRQSFLGSLVERTTRTTILVPLKNKTAEEVRKAFAKEAKKLPAQMRLSMTYDQGLEMAEHKLFTKETKMQVYFAHPASPWERGTNENTNGNIRQFFPKGTDFSKISRREVKRVQHLLNGRPRKVLGYATPYEVFNSLLR
ncbi:MAG: IS30 family transposase [Candidatus Eisenbacteria bacterium]|nr:IS30 family transposase [Candidatus Eisenbacteria bacterium]